MAGENVIGGFYKGKGLAEEKTNAIETEENSKAAEKKSLYEGVVGI